MNIKSKEEFEKTLCDENWEVRRAAVLSKHFSTYCYIRHLDDNYKDILC